MSRVDAVGSAPHDKLTAVFSCLPLAQLAGTVQANGMDTPDADTHRGGRIASRIVIFAVAVLGAAVGVVESAFGPFYALVIGLAVVILGVVVRRWDAVWSTLLLTLGAAMCLGALVYIALGLFGPSDPSSGFGSG